MKSLFQYYGGKFNQLKDILEVMNIHLNSFDLIVDVFGGSGKVLLNIPDEWKKTKIYNDLDDDLYITFKVLQDSRRRGELIKRLNLAFIHEGVFTELKRKPGNRDIDIAFRLIYLQTHSFMGDGTTFGRSFKGKTRISRYTIENFVYVKDWIIEHKDFRELMRIYNKPRVLFYLDPPYLSSGKKYKHNFTMDDLKNLKKCIDSHCGSYLLNLSTFDKGMEETFGRPNKVVECANPLNKNGKIKWGCGYWWILS
jgi:DNA adenine methylase